MRQVGARSVRQRELSSAKRSGKSRGSAMSTHFGCPVRANSQIAARFRATQQHETGVLVLGEVAFRIAQVHDAGEELTRATQASALTAG
jgi:hypothetical protein